MNDKQLLELAAKVAGISIDQDGVPWIPDMPDVGFNTGTDWNPLESDADAFRLMADLRINIGYVDEHKYIHAEAHDSPAWLTVDYTNDRAADTRRAITMAAAAMSEDE